MIRQGDCLELIKEIPDGSVDMVLTDLPFGITDFELDKRIDTKKLFKEISRVTKHNAAILMFAQMNSSKVGELPFAAQLISDSCIPFRYEIIWEKSLAVGFLNANKMPLRCHENILVFYRKLPTYNPQFTKGKPYKKTFQGSRNYGKQTPDGIKDHMDGKRFPRDVIKFNSLMGTGVIHPQQKPTELLKWLIRTYTNEGETVLDCCMGSGSTGVACAATNRQFIGFELDKDYYEIALERLKGGGTDDGLRNDKIAVQSGRTDGYLFSDVEVSRS